MQGFGEEERRVFLEGVSFDEAVRRNLILDDIEKAVSSYGQRQPMNEPARASQFLPFAALTGFDEALERACGE